jgi:xylulokinase
MRRGVPDKTPGDSAALLWNDQRTADECEEIRGVGAARLIEITGNPALTGFQAPKILWLRNHQPENYARLAKCSCPKITSASGSQASARRMPPMPPARYCSICASDYSDTILDKLEIRREWLPRVVEGPDVTGRLLPDVAAELGLPAGLPVIAGGGDNAAAAVGTGVVRAGVVSSSIGTSGVLFAHSDNIALDPQGRLHTFCHAVPQKYHMMAVTLSAGGAFRWLRDVLEFRHADFGMRNADLRFPYDQLTAMAAAVPPGGLLFAVSRWGTHSPSRSAARGAFVGLTARHTTAHLIRAVMEGGVSLRDGLEIMQGLNVPLCRFDGRRWAQSAVAADAGRHL